MPSDEYKERIAAFERMLTECFNLSQQCAGIPAPTGAHFYASVLFTTLCSRGASFGILAPGTTFATRAFDHWDYASLAVLARSILEVRIAFFYLCVQECTSVEWDCRWNLFNLHDCSSRIHLFEEMDRPANLAGFMAQADELRDRLKKNEFFLSLSESEQKRLLHGKHAYSVPLETIAQQAGVALKEFRLLYKFLSSHVHGLPMSFYRMGQPDGRGRGVYCETEDNYSSLCVSYVVSLLAASRDEMRKLFEPHIDGYKSLQATRETGKSE